MVLRVMNAKGTNRKRGGKERGHDTHVVGLRESVHLVVRASRREAQTTAVASVRRARQRVADHRPTVPVHAEDP